MLRGRRTERRAINGLLDAVRGGRSAVLVLRGEPGIGKSALLEYALGIASGFRVVRGAGVESEMELAFAGVHQLCAPLLDEIGRLPGPQRNALETAFGLSDGAPADRFFVGLAVLNLLSGIAERQPLLSLVDDAQWLDSASAQVLAFVARRLHADRVGLVFATRTASEPDELTGLPELLCEGLDATDARDLLSSVIPGPLDVRVADRIIAETHGNPLAILELSRPSARAQLAGGFGLPGVQPLSGRIQESFRQRVARLPVKTQLLLLLAAADPVGDPALLWRAAARLGLTGEAATRAESADLLVIGDRVTFRHPLVRSAVYHSASLSHRRKVHAALAAATDPDLDPDRRAWHRAQATIGVDEEVGAELERSAGRAQARGGLAAAGAFLELAVRLTPDPSRRGERALGAALAKLQAAAPEAALALVATAEAGPLDDLGRARANLLRAQIAFASTRCWEAPPLLLAAARQLEPLDPALARQTYLDALSAASFTGHLSRGIGVVEVARAALAAPPAPALQPATASDLLLDGLARVFTEGYAAGGPILRRALSAFSGEPMTAGPELRWFWLACRVALNLWDFDTFDTLSARYVQLTREAGMLTEVPGAVNTRLVCHMFSGDLAAAASLSEQAQAIGAATGNHFLPLGALGLAAFRGREAEFSALTEATVDGVVQRGEGMGLSVIQYAQAVLNNGLGRYDAALAAAAQANQHWQDIVVGAVPELIEAACRSGKPSHGAQALARLSATAHAGGTDWGLGIEAQSRALLSDGGAAEDLYREAIERLRRTRVSTALARTRLLFGEWLRRGRRRQEAREQLRSAHTMFTEMGMEAFAERAAGELLATGERARRRNVETSRQLTPQEDQVARLARRGLSNPEIAVRLFISARTVEYHLHKVFTKLDISARNELDAVLEREQRVAELH
ncbi:MAG TPA: AAA family ATPase [Candidatus Angelobacter sp.]|nr:AAA family ATPase [Candidatus Angelobacter sp.]